VGSELRNCQLSQLNNEQLDELALLIAERGMIILRDQDITADQQAAMFEYFGLTRALEYLCLSFDEILQVLWRTILDRR
jgi:hypothetical protein